MAFIDIMFLPFLACLILIGIHAYFGMHVLKRGIIFVDLAMAQIAALGGLIAMFYHQHPNSPAGYALSIVATMFGAYVLALTKRKKQHIPQEAYIGIVYAVASAGGILLAQKAPEGAEHVEAMLAGVILWVTKKTLITDALVYGAVALFHILLFKRFWAISEDYEGAVKKGWNVRFWDFLFYTSFGIVVTLSVRVAGVLLVFCFLVIPVVISSLFWEKFRTRLLGAYAIGVCVTVLGLMLSWRFDTPSGPTVAVLFGFSLIFAHVLLSLFARKGTWTQARRRLALATGGLFFIAIFTGLALFMPPIETTHSLRTENVHEPEPSYRQNISSSTPSSHDLLQKLLITRDRQNQITIFEKLLETVKHEHPSLSLPQSLEHDDIVLRYMIERLKYELHLPFSGKNLCVLLKNNELDTMKLRDDFVHWLEQTFHVGFSYDPLTFDDSTSEKAFKECMTLFRNKGTSPAQ